MAPRSSGKSSPKAFRNYLSDNKRAHAQSTRNGRRSYSLLLPQTEKYSIEAKSKFGSLSCDLEDEFHHGLKSSEYKLNAPAPAHNKP
jgi:hypothetical protein